MFNFCPLSVKPEHIQFNAILEMPNHNERTLISVIMINTSLFVYYTVPELASTVFLVMYSPEEQSKGVGKVLARLLYDCLYS